MTRPWGPTLALVLLCAARAGAAGEIPVAYLYIEANEGGSSGGHVALRIGDDAYHFQHRDGRLLLARAPFERFVYDYALLDNRTIHRSRVEVSAQTAALLRARFEARLRAQRRQLELRDELAEERGLLARLLRREPTPIVGAGYFAQASEDASREPAIDALRAEIAARRGPEFVAKRRAALEGELAALDPRSAPRLPDRLDAARRPATGTGFGRRYLELAAGLVALDVLEGAPRLRPDLLRGGGAPALDLEPPERAAVAALRDALLEGLVRLVASPRPDWGTSLLMGMARLAALHASASTGRLLVLDTYPAETSRIPVSGLPGDLAQALLAEAEGALRGARAAFVADPSEARFADVEDTANRALELLRAVREGGGVRLAPDRLLPRRAATRGRLRLPDADDAVLAASLERSQHRLRAYEALLDAVHGYHLLKHNCVSELFATAHGDDAPHQIAERLGGHVDSEGVLAVVPFISSDAVARRWRVVAADEIPSYRRARIRALSERENDLLVMLRESNTLTATTYRRTQRDSLFVFFTDGAVWPRPLFGAVNLVANLSQALQGLLRLPADGGATLRIGLGGLLASAPELAFANIRKGSNDYVPRGELSELR